MYLIPLILAVASRTSFITARPTIIQYVPSVDWMSEDILDFVRRETGATDLRSVSEIVWSCLVTVFACSWVSVHPNIPSPLDSDFAILRRRIGLMFWAIIAPELLIVWAMRQWLQASNIARIYEDQGWTKVHGHFLVMGGFMLHRDGVPTQTLSIEKFHKHLENGSIEFPIISSKEILDRSKGDLFSKVIVIIQVAWFAIQCIARRAQGLTITELEIVTLAFTTLNGAMYAFWWNKPLDIRCPVRVDFRSKPKLEAEAETPEVSSPTPDPELDPEQSPLLAQTQNVTQSVPMFRRVRDEEEWVYMDMLRKDEMKRRRSGPIVEHTPVKLRFWTQISNAFTSSRDAITQPFVLIWKYIMKEGPFSVLYDGFVHWPIKNVLDGLGDIVESDESKKVAVGALRVPMFYAPMVVPRAVGLIRTAAAILGVVFGSIHMAAWSGTFALHSEQTAWRVASLIITVIPAIILLANVLNHLLDRATDSWEDCCCEGALFYVEYLVGAGGILVYVPSRFTLFIIAFICLGSIPPDGFERVNWTSFIPHIA